MSHSAQCAIQYDWPCNCGEDEKDKQIDNLHARLEQAGKVIDQAEDALTTYFRTFKLAEKTISAIAEYKKGEYNA